MLQRGLLIVLFLSEVIYSMGVPPPNYDNQYDSEIEEAVTADIEAMEEEKKKKLSKLALISYAVQTKTVTDKNGKKIKKSIRVDEVIKGTTVLYINRLVNEGEEEQNNIVVKNPIPKGVKYVKGSATCKEKGCVVGYSKDGGKTLSNSDDKIEVSYIEFHFSKINPNTKVLMGFKVTIE